MFGEGLRSGGAVCLWGAGGPGDAQASQEVEGDAGVMVGGGIGEGMGHRAGCSGVAGGAASGQSAMGQVEL